MKKHCTKLDHYQRDAMLARVFATATCPSVRHEPVLSKRRHDFFTTW